MGQIDLYIANEYSWDGRVSNSTSGILLHDFREAPKGSVVIFNHRATTQDNELDDKVFLIDEPFLYFYLDERNEPVPFGGNFLISRIKKKKYETKLLHIPDGWNEDYYDNVFKIEKAPKGNYDFNPGQQVIAYKYSDYEIPYAVNGVHSSVIRLKADDILAVSNLDI